MGAYDHPYSTNYYRKLSERFQNYFSISHFILNISDRILQYVVWNDATEMFQKPITCNKFEKVMRILQKRFFFAFWVTYMERGNASRAAKDDTVANQLTIFVKVKQLIAGWLLRHLVSCAWHISIYTSLLPAAGGALSHKRYTRLYIYIYILITVNGIVLLILAKTVLIYVKIGHHAINTCIHFEVMYIQIFYFT